MSEDYLAQQQPTLSWNTARGAWERAGTVNLLCEHSELFSETWQTSGTMRNGKVYELQTQVPRTDVSESSLLRSPTASQGEGGALGEKVARERGNTVGIRDQAMDIAKANGEKVTRLPTPVVADAYTGGLKSSQQKDGSMHSIALPHAIAMLPTPNTMEHREIKTPEHIAELKKRSPGGYRNLREEVIHNLPTPTTQDGKNNAGPSQFNRNTKPLNVEAVIASDTNWGRFEPAIRRWEQALGRPAPLPTKPDGKDGAHRLSSKFTEWMMGLPDGWVTDVGLTRNEELKACGNGVVPQQAELALRQLLNGVM